jgi:hypothetical protein
LALDQSGDFSHNRRMPRDSANSLALAAFLLGSVLAGRTLADSPSATTTTGSGYDRGVPSAGWAAWDSTVGGTFDNPSTPHHPTPPSGATPSSAAPKVSTRTTEIDPVMLKAATIAEHRALPHGTWQCWHYVKEALVAAGGVNSYPQTENAKEAGRDLVQHYGFVKLPVHSAERAPVGAVLVYGGPGAGHVEFRTTRGFTSDCICIKPAPLPFLGAYARVATRRDTAPAVVASMPGL